MLRPVGRRWSCLAVLTQRESYSLTNDVDQCRDSEENRDATMGREPYAKATASEPAI